jgi:hypothetical protein
MIMPAVIGRYNAPKAENPNFRGQFQFGIPTPIFAKLNSDVNYKVKDHKHVDIKGFTTCPCTLAKDLDANDVVKVYVATGDMSNPSSFKLCDIPDVNKLIKDNGGRTLAGKAYFTCKLTAAPASANFRLAITLHKFIVSFSTDQVSFDIDMALNKDDLPLDLSLAALALSYGSRQSAATEAVGIAPVPDRREAEEARAAGRKRRTTRQPTATEDWAADEDP